MLSETPSCAQVAEAFDDSFPFPWSHLAAGGGARWREQLCILMTLVIAEDSSVIDTLPPHPQKVVLWGEQQFGVR